MSTHALLANMPKNHEILSVEEAQRRFFTPKPSTTVPPVTPPTNYDSQSMTHLCHLNYDSFVPFNFFTHPDRNTPEQEKFQIIIRNRSIMKSVFFQIFYYQKCTAQILMITFRNLLGKFFLRRGSEFFHFQFSGKTRYHMIKKVQSSLGQVKT